MKFEIKSFNLFKILKKIIKITTSNNEFEELSCFLVEVEKTALILTTTNGNLAMKCEIKAEENNLKILETGSFLINAKIIYDIFSKLDDEWILFKLEINNLIISNYHNNNKDFIFKLSTLAIEKFPQINFNKENKNKIVIEKKILQTINEQLSFATNINNTIKPVLGAINFKFQAQELIITATDTSCLAKKTILLNENNKIKTQEFNIPVMAITEIDKLTNDLNNKKLNFYFENNFNLIIEIENFLFQTRMIEGIYPNTDFIINDFLTKEKSTIDITNVKDFLNVIELAIILAKKDNFPMIQFLINIKDNEFKINCLSNNDSIGQVIEQFKKFSIVTTKNNDDIKVVFNSRLIINALKSFNKCKTLTLNFSWPNNYTFITSNEEKGLLQLVLPIGEN